MISTAIGTFMLVIQAIMLCKNLTQGTILTIIFMLIAPNILSFSYELPATMLLFLAWFMFRKDNFLGKRRVELVDYNFFLIVLLSIITSIVSYFRFKLSINFISILGTIRIFMAVYVYRQFFRENGLYKLVKILNVVIVINFIASIIQMTIPSSTSLFYNLYWKPSLTPLGVMVDIGYFSRAFGTFATPLYLSCLCLLAGAVYFYLWFTERHSLKYFLFFGIVLIMTVFTYSKTSYLGMAVIILLETFFIGIFKKGKNYITKFFLLIILGIIFIALIVYMAQSNGVLQYYLSYFKDILGIFKTRYGEEGNLGPLKEVVKTYPIFGVGEVSIPGVFVGDSAYYVALYTNGFVGLVLYLVPVIKCFIDTFRKKDVLSFVIIVLYLLIGLGIVIFSNFIGAIYLGFALAQNKDIRRG